MFVLKICFLNALYVTTLYAALPQIHCKSNKKLANEQSFFTA